MLHDGRCPRSGSRVIMLPNTRSIKRQRAQPLGVNDRYLYGPVPWLHMIGSLRAAVHVRSTFPPRSRPRAVASLVPSVPAVVCPTHTQSH
ncbi:unnamed protein product [Danaus chrysippus]|uniref:(African queen) hypothetical protein n=1 Tax=Danaus chrysippus TaxID=151541 RepID=A0A8J2R156_9NEOP|nr:unnamed protein product [Danaus chrysippus]